MHAACRCAYAKWSTSAKDCSDFFIDPQVRSMFKRNIAKIAFRNNTITGIPYNRESTILGVFCMRPMLSMTHVLLLGDDPAQAVTYC